MSADGLRCAQATISAILSWHSDRSCAVWNWKWTLSSVALGRPCSPRDPGGPEIPAGPDGTLRPDRPLRPRRAAYAGDSGGPSRSTRSDEPDTARRSHPTRLDEPRLRRADRDDLVVIVVRVVQRDVPVLVAVEVLASPVGESVGAGVPLARRCRATAGNATRRPAAAMPIMRFRIMSLPSHRAEVRTLGRTNTSTRRFFWKQPSVSSPQFRFFSPSAPDRIAAAEAPSATERVTNGHHPPLAQCLVVHVRATRIREALDPDLECRVLAS